MKLAGIALAFMLIIVGCGPRATQSPSTPMPTPTVVPAADSTAVPTGRAAPAIGNVTPVTSDQVPVYDKFEVSFPITNTTATNFYFPYSTTPLQGITPEIRDLPKNGINVDVVILPPGNTDWNNATIVKTQPCFYYQPVEEVGTGANLALLPVGNAQWRCRFTPDTVGTWQYKLKAADAGGVSESQPYLFNAITSTNKGFVRVSQTDSRFFELSDGTPFVSTLVNVDPGFTIADIRRNIQKLGQNGIHFIRWFPTGEGGEVINPFGDDIRTNWTFSLQTKTDDVDASERDKFSFAPFYYAGQNVTVKPNAKYKLTLRAKVIGEQVLQPEVQVTPSGENFALNICSASSTFHQANGCESQSEKDGWNTYVLEFTTPADAAYLRLFMHGLFVASDAPAPYNAVRPGAIRVGKFTLQRDEAGSGGWGSNQLTRSDPNTYNYVDQLNAARLDEVFRLSEEYGVYNKLALFHKNDAVLNAFQSDGTLGDFAQCQWGLCPNNFYSADGQVARWLEQAYTRYFIARWSYSPALHSLELANENDLTSTSYEAGWAFSKYVRDTSSRRILVTNSFWGYWVSDYFMPETRPTDAPLYAKYKDYGQYIDYSDKHWYADKSGSDCTNGLCDVISNKWDDSAAYQRECFLRFKEYSTWGTGYHKPIVRGEGGVADSGTAPQMAGIALEPQGVYYHKKLWAHLGVLGYSCDGEWYPRLYEAYGSNQFPNSSMDTLKIYAAYDKFIQGEPLNNGHYKEIGTDLAGAERIQVSTSSGSLRAWGSRDAEAGKVLLWIDNANQTWIKVLDQVDIPAASGSLTIQGLPQGLYSIEWWDTDTGLMMPPKDIATVNTTGQLTLNINGLTKDKAVKIHATDISSPSSAP